EVVLFHRGRWLLERVPASHLLVAVVLLTAVRWVLTAVAERDVFVIGLQLGHVISFSTFHLAALVLLARLVPPGNSSSGQSLYGIAGFALGGSAGLWLAGALVGPLGT